MISKVAELGRSVLRPYKQQETDLFDFFGEDGELEIGGWEISQIRNLLKTRHSYGMMFQIM
jgi:hypothetical protein